MKTTPQPNHYPQSDGKSSFSDEEWSVTVENLIALVRLLPPEEEDQPNENSPQLDVENEPASLPSDDLSFPNGYPESANGHLDSDL